MAEREAVLYKTKEGEILKAYPTGMYPPIRKRIIPRVKNAKTGKMEQDRERCRIIECGPESKQAFIMLGSLIHRGPLAFDAFTSRKIGEEYGATTTIVDWPKDEFDPEKVVQQLAEYIEQSPYDSIILAGLSFGEVVLRQVVDRLSPDALQKIKLHLSVCGVATAEDIKIPGNTLLAKNTALIRTRIARSLAGLVGRFERNTVPLPKFTKHLISQTQVAPPEQCDPPLTAKRRVSHQQAASLGITPAFSDRLAYMLEAKVPENMHNFPTVAMYSTNDPLIEKSGAEKILKTSSDQAGSRLVEVENGWHCSVMEKPNIWEPALRSVLDGVWERKKPLSE